MMDTNATDENERFLNLIHTIQNPGSATAIPADELALSLGIQAGSSKDEALKLLETEILAPVRDLSGSELWRWQVYVWQIFYIPAKLIYLL
jgi:hypothetical protein